MTAAEENRQDLPSTHELLARHAAARPQATALVDPVNRQTLTDGAPQEMSFANLDGAVSRLAAHLLSYGLKAGDVVLVQLANTVEMPLTLLALARAGLIAAPVPAAWGLHEVRKAAGSIRPRAIITCCRLQQNSPAERMRHVAFDTASVRFVFAFGATLPDGVIGLDEMLQSREAPALPETDTGKAGQLALVTFEEAAGGDVQALARSHAQLHLAAAQAFELMELDEAGTLLCPYLLSSLTGLAAGFHAWLRSGCRLVLHHPFSSAALGVQMESHNPSHLLLPATVASTGQMAPLLEWQGLECLLLGWPPRRISVYPQPACRTLNLISLGELALFAGLAREPGPPRVPLGRLDTLVNGRKTTLIDTRLKGEARSSLEIASMNSSLEARLEVRGAALPNVLGSEPREDGFCDTGLLACPVATLPPSVQITGQAELVAVGNLRFDAGELAAIYASHDGVAQARVSNEEDLLLGNRLVCDIASATGEYITPEDLSGVIAAHEMAQYKLPSRIGALEPHTGEQESAAGEDEDAEDDRAGPIPPRQAEAS